LIERDRPARSGEESVPAKKAQTSRLEFGGLKSMILSNLAAERTREPFSTFVASVITAKLPWETLFFSRSLAATRIGRAPELFRFQSSLPSPTLRLRYVREISFTMLIIGHSGGGKRADVSVISIFPGVFH